MLSRLRGFLRRRSSLADETEYTGFCRKAARDENVFATFRRAPAYNRILEHTSESQGAEYLEIIIQCYPRLRQSFDAFRRNDAVGHPVTFEYHTGGVFSPTTLRYIKVLGDLETLFGDLSALNIVEIGVGYGGQCRIVDAHRGFGSYSLIDLPPCLDLAGAYLDRFETRNTRFLTMDDLGSPLRSDLVVSNYAFSECTRSIQELYMERVINTCPRGYLTMNTITPQSFRSLTQRELLTRIPHARALPEEPLTHDGNYIIVWGDLSS